MLSFEQFLIEGLLATRVKDKKFLHPARQALKNVGFLSDNAEFNIINTHKTEGFKLNDILTKRGVYGINSTIKNIHLVGIPKTPIVGDDKLNKHSAVYRIPSTIGNTALYKLVPQPNGSQPQSKPILAKDVKDELNQWDRLLVVTTLGQEKDNPADQDTKQHSAEQKNQKQTQDTPEEKKSEHQQNQKSATDSTDKVKSGSVDLGEYVNPFRDRVAKIPDYQLMACYVSKNDGKPHVQVKAGKYDIGLAFVDFNEPIAKNGKLTFRCQTLTPKSFLKTLDTSNLFTKAKSFLGITTTDVDKYRSSAVVIGEAFKDIVSAMQGSAEVAQILSEIEINKLPVK
jgi:hypothetical protein